MATGNKKFSEELEKRTLMFGAKIIKISIKNRDQVSTV